MADNLPLATTPGTSPPAITSAAALYPQGADVASAHTLHVEPEIKVVGHSRLLYWWPVWVAGYGLTIYTWLDGQFYQVGDGMVRFHPSHNVGLIFLLILFGAIIISNVTFRGLLSVVVILVALLVAVVVIYFGWWNTIVGWFGELKIYLNQGAYFWFSTLLFLAWAFTVFFFDQFSYWRIRPGQITQEYILGAGSRSFGTGRLTLEKRSSDLFRHWLIGFGSGDLTIRTSGATHEQIYIQNVLFIHSKIHAIQRMIAELPEAGATSAT